MIEKWNITIPELTGEETRAAYIYVPDIIEEDPDLRFPVLYMFDGHNVFFDEDATYGKSWGMAEFAEGVQLPIIIAAVECNHGPNNDRLREYAPFSFKDKHFGYIPGDGPKTMEWFVEAFKPFIDETYPTLPEREYTFIGGSSMGGLMSLYAVTAYNHVFSRAAALSPSVWFGNDKLDRLICNSYFDPNTVIYMDYGENEMPNHKGMKRQFIKIVTRLLERGVKLDCRIVPNGDHSEASWERQIPFFMSTLLYGIDIE